MPADFDRTGDKSKPGLRLGLRPGDRVVINDELEIEFIGNQGNYIRLLFSGDATKWKIRRGAEVKS
jgi:hypothetical protein